MIILIQITASAIVAPPATTATKRLRQTQDGLLMDEEAASKKQRAAKHDAMQAIKKESIDSDDGSKRKGGKIAALDGVVELLPEFKLGKSNNNVPILSFNKDARVSAEDRAILDTCTITYVLSRIHTVRKNL